MLASTSFHACPGRFPRQFVGFCGGVNFRNATTTDSAECVLYIREGQPATELPTSVSSCTRTDVQPPSTITGVSYGAIGSSTFEETSCYTLLNCSSILSKAGEWVQMASSQVRRSGSAWSR